MERCSFCGRKLNMVSKMIQAPRIKNVYICDMCSETAYSISHNVDDINKKSAGILRKDWENASEMSIVGDDILNDSYELTPHMIHSELNRYIVGQDHVKKSLSVALSNHCKRIHDDSNLIKKSSCLLIGASGTGKTLIAQTAANILKLPFAIVDVSRMTAPGYVGDNSELCLQRLVEKANGNINLAEKGIIFLDEIDKLSRSNENINHSNGCSGVNVQSNFLKLIEGCDIEIQVAGKNSLNNTSVTINTKNILFICSGAFTGLTDETNNPIGFNATSSNPNDKRETNITPKMLVKYGLMHELVGRLPIILHLNTLQEEDLLRILTEPEDSIIREYEVLFEKYGSKVTFEEEALLMVAKLAFQNGTGARGIRAILEPVLLNIIYDIEKNPDIARYIITKDTITTKIPIVKKKRKQRAKATTLS